MLWPSTPTNPGFQVRRLRTLTLVTSAPTNPGVAFHFNLLENLRMLVVECQLSIHGFFEALKWKTDGTLKNTIVRYYQNS
jgi:hypothetical protein